MFCIYLAGLAGALFSAGALVSIAFLGFSKNITERMHNAAITPIVVHVPFSITSVLCFTPITCEPMLPKEPVSPPPFGF